MEVGSRMQHPKSVHRVQHYQLLFGHVGRIPEVQDSVNPCLHWDCEKDVQFGCRKEQNSSVNNCRNSTRCTKCVVILIIPLFKKVKIEEKNKAPTYNKM